jgi:hypothetical protein
MVMENGLALSDLMQKSFFQGIRILENINHSKTQNQKITGGIFHDQNSF